MAENEDSIGTGARSMTVIEIYRQLRHLGGVVI
jgi:hypothetical protein